MTEQDRRTEFAEEAASLLRITLGPLVWAIHFVICYGLSAVWCAKLAEASIDPLRVGIGGMTVLALAVIGWLGWRSWVQWDFLDDFDREHGGGFAEDRHEFLGTGLAVCALAGLPGASAVIFSGLYNVSARLGHQPGVRWFCTHRSGMR